MSDTSDPKLVMGLSGNFSDYYPVEKLAVGTSANYGKLNKCKQEKGVLIYTLSLFM